MNRMSYDAAFSMLLKVIKMGFKVERIICDQVGPPKTHERELRMYCGEHLSDDTQIICESKADDTYPVVSASSIVAKVVRDTILKDWEFVEEKIARAMEVCPIDIEMKFNRSWGCGYPSDPLAKAWLRNCFDPVYGFPSCIRFSWSTARKFLQTDGKKDGAYWFDLIDEEKKNNPKGKGAISKS